MAGRVFIAFLVAVATATGLAALSTEASAQQVPPGCKADGRTIICPHPGAQPVNRDGLTEAQVRQGCKGDGRTITCPHPGAQPVNRDGLTEAQVRQGCKGDGRTINCPHPGAQPVNRNGLTEAQVKAGCVVEGRYIYCPHPQQPAAPTKAPSNNRKAQPSPESGANQAAPAYNPYNNPYNSGWDYSKGTAAPTIYNPNYNYSPYGH